MNYQSVIKTTGKEITRYCWDNNIQVSDWYLISLHKSHQLRIIFFRFDIFIYEFVLRTDCSQICNKWKSNDIQSALHRLWVKHPSKVTLDEVQPSARCLWSTKSNFITLYISALGWSSHQEWFTLCYEPVKQNLNAVFCNLSSAWWTHLHSSPFTFLLWRSSEMCSSALKEEFHLILALCFPSVHFCYAQLSKHEARLDIRHQHLSPYTHKPLSFGSFSVFVQD